MTVSVLTHLIAWATASTDTPLAVLYGEKGDGKTVIAQGVVYELRQAPASQTRRWTPYYFGLKHTDFAGSSVPTLREILTESIRRHWVAEGPLYPTGEAILATAQAQPTLFVVDGLEWLFQRWAGVAQRQTLMHEVLKLVPQQNAAGEWWGPYAGSHAKVLLTLRPAYQELLHDQLTTRHRYQELALASL